MICSNVLSIGSKMCVLHRVKREFPEQYILSNFSPPLTNAFKLDYKTLFKMVPVSQTTESTRRFSMPE